MNKKRLIGLSAVLSFVVMTITGCATPSYNVEVYLSKQFREQMKIYPSLEVDVAGVNTNEAERFDTCVVEDYFESGNTLRRSTDHVTICFSEDSVTPKRLDGGHPIWKKFGRKDADQLYLLVNLPMNASKKQPGKDARRIVIPLERGWFWFSPNRYFEVSPAGILRLKEPPANHPPVEKIAKNAGEQK